MSTLHNPLRQEKKKKKHKKERKSKQKKKEKEKPNTKASLAVDQNEYGKFGVIREDNFFQKQREFEAYMSEVKGMPGLPLYIVMYLL